MTISVIVPAYNAQNTIQLTLSALSNQDYQDKFEIIVVDDGSVDKTAQIIQSFDKVKYVHQVNAGPAAARNRGAKEAQGQILAFTDSDCVPHKNWLSQLVKGFKDSSIGVVMGSYGIANPQYPLAYCVHQEIIFRHEKLLSDFPKVFGSYNFCVRKTVFELVGGFDVSFRRASGEDNDLSYKINAAGLKIYFERKALVDHYHPTQIRKYLREQFHHGYWRVMMYFNHPKMVAGDGYTFWKDIIEIPFVCGCLVGLAFILFGFIGLKQLIVYYVLPFFIFELCFAKVMLNNFKNDFFWGFIMFLRSFSRFFGLSTGVFWFFCKKILNKS